MNKRSNNRKFSSNHPTPTSVSPKSIPSLNLRAQFKPNSKPKYKPKFPKSEEDYSSAGLAQNSSESLSSERGAMTGREVGVGCEGDYFAMPHTFKSPKPQDIPLPKLLPFQVGIHNTFTAQKQCSDNSRVNLLFKQHTRNTDLQRISHIFYLLSTFSRLVLNCVHPHDYGKEYHLLQEFNEKMQKQIQRVRQIEEGQIQYSFRIQDSLIHSIPVNSVNYQNSSPSIFYYPLNKISSIYCD